MVSIKPILVLLVFCTLCSVLSTEVAIDQDYDDDDTTFPVIPDKAVLVEDKVLFNALPHDNQESNLLAGKTNYSRLIHEFLPEAFLLLFIAFYYGVYSIGSSNNEERAKIWLKASLEFFTQQFSRLGDERGFFLMKNGADDFIFYASGRLNCNFVYGHIQLFPRHDLFRMLYSLYEPADDVVELSFELPEDTPNVVFGIIPRRSANKMRKERFDVNTFTKQLNDPFLPEGFVLLTEHGDVSKSFSSEPIMRKLAEVKDTFEGFVLSDQPRSRPESLPKESHKVLTFKYRLGCPEQHLALNCLALFLVDYISTLEVRPDVRNKLARNREEAFLELRKAEQERRQEEVERRLQEKRRKELEARAQLSPAAQRKLEEKEARRTNRKKAAKMTMKVR